jgi:hypothetical protein
MKTAAKHKHFVLDEAKIRRVKKVLGARTETEAIEKALDEVLQEHERNEAAWRAHERFIKSGIQIKDVYGRLDGR